MITWRNGTVSGMRREWTGAVELDVAVDGDAGEPGQVRALAYPALTGRPQPGDRVLLNTTALDLKLAERVVEDAQLYQAALRSLAPAASLTAAGPTLSSESSTH